MSGWSLSIAEARARYVHGTYARYKLARCRCHPCRFAHSEYNRARTEARPPWQVRYAPEVRRYLVRHRDTAEILLRTHDRAEAHAKRDELNRPLLEDPRDLIGATRACQHIAWLRSQGVGVHTIARATGLSRTALTELAAGRHSRVRRGTAEKILSVGLSDATGSALVGAAHAWELLGCLLEAGWPKTRIARELGSTARTPALRISRDRIYASTAHKVEEVHGEAWRTDPRVRAVCQHERSRIQMENTAHARAYGTTVRARERKSEREEVSA